MFQRISRDGTSIDECPGGQIVIIKKSSFLLGYSNNGMRFLLLQVVSRI